MNKIAIVLGFLLSAQSFAAPAVRNTKWVCANGTVLVIESAFNDGVSYFNYFDDAKDPEAYFEGHLTLTEGSTDSGTMQDDESTPVGVFQFVGDKFMLTLQGLAETECRKSGNARE